MAGSTAPVPPKKGRVAYKLLRVRRDKTLGPLFIHKQQVIPIGEWLEAHEYPTPGFTVRKGWHTCAEPRAAHLTVKGRRWMKVEVADYKKLVGPQFQGKAWLLANWMKVIGPVPAEEIL